MKPQTIIFIGRSGCGKGTQAKLVQEYLKKNDSNARPILYLETGSRFREFIKGQSFSSQLSKKVYDKNDRQPNFLAVWLWSNVFVEQLTGEEHLVIDGAPRSLEEAKMLDNAMAFYERKINIVYPNVSRVLSERRLLERGRIDDKDLSMIAKRLDWFDNEVVPAIEYFKNETDHNFIEVSGERPVEVVSEDIISKLKFD
jgi:adenylate kinase family enzyme